jgi:elongation factor P
LNQLKSGDAIKHKGKNFLVEKINHISKGRGSAVMKFDLKELKTGRKLTESFQPGDALEGSFYSILLTVIIISKQPARG